MNELVQDVEKHDLKLSPAELRHSKRLKEKLLDHFGEKIQFTKIGNKNVLHSTDVNPQTYTKATLKRHGLKEEDIAKTFVNLIRRKLKKKASEKKILKNPCRLKPLILSEFLSSLNEGKPVSSLFKIYKSNFVIYKSKI